MEHERFMTAAIDQARLAGARGEVPVGAVVVHQGSVIGAAHNRRELDQDPTAHAEILALRQAATRLGSWRLCGARLYVTLEPCVMCAGALVHARVEELIYGCDDPKAGAVRTLYRICEDERLNHHLQVTCGILADECGKLLSDFFADLRRSRAL